MPLISADSKLLRKTYGDATGPLGLPMRSDEARELERLLKSLPKECRELGLLHVTPDVKGVDFSDDEHADISFVTTGSLDRDREVVLPGGADWKQFRKNPVVTFAHDYSALPVGRSLWVKRETKGGMDGWLAKTRFTPRPDSHPAAAEWFPDTVWHFVREGDLPGKSIGFIALNYRPPEEKEIKANPAYAKARGVIDKWLALEYAVTPVQSNPDALVTSVAKARKKGLTVEEFLDRAGLVVPDELPPAGVQAGRKEPTLEERLKGKISVVTPRAQIDVRSVVHRRAAELIKKIDLVRAIGEGAALASGRI